MFGGGRKLQNGRGFRAWIWAWTFAGNRLFCHVIKETKIHLTNKNFCATMLGANIFLLVELISTSSLVVSQEQSEHWPDSYSVWPYLHVYPPTNTSIDQKRCVPGVEQNETCPLHVLLITSFGGSFVSSGIIPAIQLAVDQINARADLLQGYTLHYNLMDSQVS